MIWGVTGGISPPGKEGTEAHLGRGLRRHEAVAVQKKRWPPRALAVAETRPRGPTGRVGAGHRSPGLPRDEARLPHDWAATPQAASVICKDAREHPNGCSQ